ncbi:MAG: phosphoribosylanthranilate isomerase [Oscillatoriales cyanobacterium]|nr:MAG: phosphoribosylanthranilate isomerase [Oscillatoriales cyanobacterium]TAE05363.1 MAG: phosphoribosylanthranilate isomerase [Oscillatoriales cyanobacterium]TAF01986.1 MAG: phosphoribosylanthranilate isomerase [Oscillatoriales cyanobacterium]TAF42996.1 MAG: phosphoribosylanthranilate isomerase [Oscillatoriales cyanobacterium]TAF69376.1 MAG: phosphoribosylanthranilate isomerase [Oscillatoriales cyanobacterium]
MRVKICGITKVEQGIAIAGLGAQALGFICVPASPRYVSPETIRLMVEHLPATVDRIGVFANTTIENICQVVAKSNLTGVQLHGDETAEYGDRLRELLPKIEIIKALRVKTPETLDMANMYAIHVDTLLLDAYHPDQLGGTGKTLDWKMLAEFRPSCPWLLAGGLRPDNVLNAIGSFAGNNFSGIDLSSGVEIAPGDKDLTKVADLFDQLKKINK